MDNSQTYWRVQNITTSANFPGFYLVHLRFGPAPTTLEDTRVLSPREFAALIRERGLRAVEPPTAAPHSV